MITDDDIKILPSLKTDFTNAGIEKRFLIFKKIETTTSWKTANLKAINEFLLFSLSYPASFELYSFTLKLLLHINEIKNKKVKGCFSYGLCKKLIDESCCVLKLIETGSDEGEQISVLSHIVGQPAIEVLLEGHLTIEQWFKEYRNIDKSDTLKDWIRLFNKSDLTAKLKEKLWLGLQFTIEIEYNPTDCILSFARNIYTHNGISKSVDITAIFSKPFKKIKLRNEEFEAAILSARLTLAGLEKETEPVSNTSVDLCRMYDAGNGLQVLLMDMVEGMRQPIDSYIGYMAFKNGVPIAYGGGWILMDSCRIGVNIFPSFRGGESAFIFTQICALYAHVFSLNRFTVDPYQIGKNNADGIKSGAFWMYYKMGFRPMDENLRLLANEEWSIIKAQKGYRTSASVLKKLSASKLEWIINSGKQTFRFDATDLSKWFASPDSSKKETEKFLKPIRKAKREMNEWEYVGWVKKNSTVHNFLKHITF